MADDYISLRTSLTQFLDAIATDKGIAYNNESDLRLIKQLIALLRSKAAANGCPL